MSPADSEKSKKRDKAQQDSSYCSQTSYTRFETDQQGKYAIGAQRTSGGLIKARIIPDYGGTD